MTDRLRQTEGPAELEVLALQSQDLPPEFAAATEWILDPPASADPEVWDASIADLKSSSSLERRSAEAEAESYPFRIVFGPETFQPRDAIEKR